ncbi:hypothetical protein J2W55_003301 [Mucilaginibacter pocheonensis]|uniref:Uncharacterized protein n=1 Tax=Mucilaginibacter pocheonensis TaxID=398050 RepID=A0ABU1TDM0_9SPHI|nr:hypothetical protein [Mucilaginibacter pocheonensis]
MIFDSQQVYQWLIMELDKRTIRYSVHEFASGNKMVDIWHNNLFYVIQIESNFAGVSLIIDDNSGFDLTPDAKFTTTEQFLSKLKYIMNH